jgi:nucleotide-binding universal stress UspA family protein
VLAPVDNDTAFGHSVDAANELAAAIGAELHLVHVKVIQRSMRAVRGPMMTPTERSRAEAEAQEILDRMRRRVEGNGGSVAGAHIRFSDGVERGLIESQERVGADLLVVPGRLQLPLPQRMRRGPAPVSTGALLRHATCSVLVVQPPGPTP